MCIRDSSHPQGDRERHRERQLRLHTVRQDRRDRLQPPERRSAAVHVRPGRVLQRHRGADHGDHGAGCCGLDPQEPELRNGHGCGHERDAQREHGQHHDGRRWQCRLHLHQPHQPQTHDRDIAFRNDGQHRRHDLRLLDADRCDGNRWRNSDLQRLRGAEPLHRH